MTHNQQLLQQRLIKTAVTAIKIHSLRVAEYIGNHTTVYQNAKQAKRCAHPKTWDN
jgi:hypothetical protein